MSATLKNAIRAVNRTALMLGSISTLAISSAAFAQEEGALMEEIEVTGIRGALKAAIDTKRFANASVDAISAEDIGKFPDKNIAESLQRVPGVSINRGFSGEGNEVSIRGVNPELTSVLMNGQFVASTGWFSLGANNRSFNMDLLPSELVSNVEVFKSPTASLDEGGIGGTVIVHTRKPLELDSLTTFVSVEAMTNTEDDEDEISPSGSALLSWKNDAETFGLMGSVAYQETRGVGKKSENYWEEAWSVGGISEFRQQRERTTFDLTAQFAPTDALDITAHYFNTELDASNTNQNFLLFGGCCDATGQSAVVNGSSSVSPTTGVPMAGTLTGPAAGTPGWQGWMIAQDINSREAVITSEVFDVNVAFEGDGYSVSGVVGWTEGEGGNGGNLNSLWGLAPSDPSLVANGGNVSADFDFDGSNFVYGLNGISAADGSWQQLLGGPSISEVELTDEEIYAQVDLELEVDFGAITSIETGIKLREHEFSSSATDFSVDSSFIGMSNLDAFQDGTISTSSDVVDGGESAVAKISDSFDSTARANINGATERYDQFGQIDEDMFALYGQANFEGEGYRGNVGIRYVETDLTGTFYQPDLVTKDDVDGSYSDWLPSMNLAIDLSDDVILRASAARVMSRPSYSDLNPALSSPNQSQRTAGRGNIDLDPYRASQMDLGVEWYFAEGGLASATAFTKDIKSFVVQGAVQNLEPVLEDPDGDGVYTSQLYTVSQPGRGNGGSIEGIELQYQQTFGQFGVVANYTYTDASGEVGGETVPLPGNSRNSYNLTGYYENDYVAARLAYTYRDEFLATSLGLGDSLDINEEQEYLDASITWHATDAIDVSLEAQNLLNEVVAAAHNTSLGSNRVSSVSGTRYYLKAAFRM
jgi:iron complex outermembrane receptor protein